MKRASPRVLVGMRDGIADDAKMGTAAEEIVADYDSCDIALVSETITEESDLVRGLMTVVGWEAPSCKRAGRAVVCETKMKVDGCKRRAVLEGRWRNMGRARPGRG